MPRLLFSLLALLAILLPAAHAQDATPPSAGSFQITFDPTHQPTAYTGRVYIVLAQGSRGEPRAQMGNWFSPPQVLSLDVKDIRPGASAVVGADALAFPKPFAEIAEVSVSEDGVTWHTFPCTATEYPWGACAGWHTVSKEDSSSLDPEKVGGDPFDLHDIGVTRAKFVRIVDKGGMACNPVNNPKTNGFDLDAIAALHVSK